MMNKRQAEDLENLGKFKQQLVQIKDTIKENSLNMLTNLDRLTVSRKSDRMQWMTDYLIERLNKQQITEDDALAIQKSLEEDIALLKRRISNREEN